MGDGFAAQGAYETLHSKTSVRGTENKVVGEMPKRVFMVQYLGSREDERIECDMVQVVGGMVVFSDGGEMIRPYNITAINVELIERIKEES